MNEKIMHNWKIVVQSSKQESKLVLLVINNNNFLGNDEYRVVWWNKNFNLFSIYNSIEFSRIESIPTNWNRLLGCKDRLHLYVIIGWPVRNVG